MSGFETVIYEKEDGVASVTLNRPRVLNAIDLTMRDELWTLFEAVRLDPDVGVVVFRGAGGRAFSSGADIRDFGSAPSYVEARRARQERDLWRLLLAIEKPLIASLHGHVVGAGLELSLCCDLRIAGESARLGLPELALGYLPAAGGSQTLPRMVGPGRALHMILSGEPVDAATREGSRRRRPRPAARRGARPRSAAPGASLMSRMSRLRGRPRGSGRRRLS
jgi:enoyl-CoA hydratase/carnithine racemase